MKNVTAACDNSTDDWPVGEAADHLLVRLDRLRNANPGHGVAVIAGGELSSPVIGDGVGGRNSAFVLNCVEKIAGKKIAVLSAGTDGKDGSSPAAGAVADGETLKRARAANLDPQEFERRSDSYNFFRQLGDAIQTGPTGNNLRDLRILLAESPLTKLFAERLLPQNRSETQWACDVIRATSVPHNPRRLVPSTIAITTVTGHSERNGGLLVLRPAPAGRPSCSRGIPQPVLTFLQSATLPKPLSPSRSPTPRASPLPKAAHPRSPHAVAAPACAG